MTLPTPLSSLVLRLPAGHRIGDPGDLSLLWGGKAVGLAALARLGVRIPATWLLSVDAAGGLVAESAGRRLRLPAGIERWAVRSSASVEDGVQFSFAGQFRTELDLPPEQVPDAVRRVVASAAQGRAAVYGDVVTGAGGSAAGASGRIAAPARMAVVLQEYREPAAAGVWIGRSSSAGRLEWCSGSGERLVSGAVIPAVEEWDAGAGRPGTAGALASREGAVGAACLGLQRRTAMPLDLEFALLDDVLVWLQARAVTRGLSSGVAAGGARSAGARLRGTGADAEADGKGRLFRGFAASGGTAQATGFVLRAPHRGKWVPGGILVVPTTDPDWLPLMVTAAGLVTASGGLLCHAAIVARELGLPAVTGVGEALLSVADGRRLTVDGDVGTVTLSLG
jgi:pyruvate,water dikinase